MLPYSSGSVEPNNYWMTFLILKKGVEAITTTMGSSDRQILNIIQTTFPLVERPFENVGSQVDLSEEEVIQRIDNLKRQNVIRQISAIFDTRRLGYKTTLVAARLPQESLDAGAQIINQHPGVSHNYERDGYFNLWFTIAVSADEDLEESVSFLTKQTKAEAVRMMPTIKFFKIGVNFDMIKNEGNAVDYFSPDGYNKSGQGKWNEAQTLTKFDIQVIRELQEDLDLISTPFESMAQRLNISQTELFQAAHSLTERELMRRFSAVLHHRKAGFGSNAMAVWKVPTDRSTEVGYLMAQSKWVTHCYERPTFPDWPYTHFTMIHATSRDQCEKVAHEISNQTGISDYQLLYSTREYKKTRVRYFV